MKEKASIEERENALWAVEAEDAIHFADWMHQFGQLIFLAHKARSDKDCRDIVGVMRTINRDKFARVQVNFREMLTVRLKLERDYLGKMKAHGLGGENKPESEAEKAVKGCVGELEERNVPRAQWLDHIRPALRKARFPRSDKQIGRILAKLGK
jgi:hypothetical protein